jgi:hypothetical protein
VVSDNGGYMEDEICVDSMPSSCESEGDEGEDLFYLAGYGCLEEILCRWYGGVPDKEGTMIFFFPLFFKPSFLPKLFFSIISSLF